MNLKMLVQLSDSGALRLVADEDTGIVTLGGVEVTDAQLRMILGKIGWLEYDMEPAEIMKRTNQYINGFKRHISSDIIIDGTDITFQNRRKLGTMSYFDRIKMICPTLFDITVLNGMPGVGGKYGVYSAVNNFKHPIAACSSLKSLGQWINGLVA